MLISRKERPAKLHIGIDVHQISSVFNVFNPVEGDRGAHRSQKVETTADGFRQVLEPLAGRCEVVFEVGPMTQWVADLVRPYATKLTVANPSRIPWLFLGRTSPRSAAGPGEISRGDCSGVRPPRMGRPRILLCARLLAVSGCFES